MQLLFDAILLQIQNSELPPESKADLMKRLQGLQKEVARLDFKYQRVVQDKHALDIFLKESLDVLEKRKEEMRLINEETQIKNATLMSMEEELRQNTEHLQLMNERLEDMVIKRTEEIALQKTIIEDRNEKILQSIGYAQNIQESIFPHLSEIQKTFRDAFIFFRPRDIVSGDFYWFQPTETGGIVAVIDCTGHGVPGAFMSMICNEFLNQTVLEQCIVEPALILQQLHSRVRTSLKQALGKNRDGADAVIVKVDYKVGKWSFAGAKNVVLCIKNKENIIIKGDKYAIGGEQREASRTFTTHTFPIERGEILYLYSDGFQDQFGGEFDKKYTSSAFRGLLYSIHELSSEEQARVLETTFLAWKGSKEQIDDVMVLGIKL